MRQNASSTPGVSARLTSVELSENATTTPSHRERAQVRALGVREVRDSSIAVMVAFSPSRPGGDPRDDEAVGMVTR